MSRLTAAQIIAQGDYLEPDFEPTTLTISQLLGVLGFHNIVYPTPYSKAKLVAVFNDEVKRRASKFKKERLKKENSIASDDGIKDGVTGEYISKKSSAIRRSSRRLSRAPPDDDDDIEPVRPDPPKRRRSSAQPRLGGSSRHAAAPVQPALQEESEPEEVEPVRKVGRVRKSTATAEAQSRRVSNADDSGWEDNNIFQSGAESSSPVRPSPVRSKGRRSSAAPRKSRKSMSAPPNVSPSFSPPKASHVPPFSPPHSKFEPDLPEFIPPSIGSTPSRNSGQWNFVSKPYSPPSRGVKYEDYEVDLKEESEEEEQAGPLFSDLADPERVPQFDEAIDEGSEVKLQDQEEVEAQSDENEDGGNTHNAVIQQRIADGAQIVKRARDSLLLDEPKPMSLLSRFFVLMLFSAMSYLTYEYKTESASIGYCDTGSNTNRVLEDLRTMRALVSECNTENRTTLYDTYKVADTTPCPPLPLNPIHPESCTPCPEHAFCSGHTITCEKAYILKSPLPLAFLEPNSNPSNKPLSTSLSPSDMAWKVISEVADGLPLFGSVAFTPSCVEDPRRKRHIGALGKGIEALLAQHRGQLLCNAEAEKHVKDEDGGEARRWGMQVNELKNTMRQGADPQRVLPNFDDLFNEAVQQLSQWGGILISEDLNGERYLAHKDPKLSWTCKLTVKSRDTWQQWRATVVGLALLAAFIRQSSARRASKKVESKRIAGLVQIALDALQNQETAHYTDPVNSTQPYLSSIQLRDLVLQDENSVAVRQKVWDKVEKIVEGNANVRANMEEVYGGDELRVWRWVGSAGRSIDNGRSVFRPIGSRSGSQSPGEDAE